VKKKRETFVMIQKAGKSAEFAKFAV